MLRSGDKFSRWLSFVGLKSQIPKSLGQPIICLSCVLGKHRTNDHSDRVVVLLINIARLPLGAYAVATTTVRGDTESVLCFFLIAESVSGCNNEQPLGWYGNAASGCSLYAHIALRPAAWYSRPGFDYSSFPVEVSNKFYG